VHPPHTPMADRCRLKFTRSDGDAMFCRFTRPARLVAAGQSPKSARILQLECLERRLVLSGGVGNAAVRLVADALAVSVANDRPAHSRAVTLFNGAGGVDASRGNKVKDTPDTAPEQSPDKPNNGPTDTAPGRDVVTEKQSNSGGNGK